MFASFQALVSIAIDMYPVGTGSCGSADLSSCCNRLHRHQRVSAGVDAEEHARFGTKAHPKDAQPIAAKVLGQTTGGYLPAVMSCVGKQRIHIAAVSPRYDVTGPLYTMSDLQVDEEPGIRANTTILLGNLASHLSEAACKRVLLNAFTRALKDTFPPARLAGVKVSYDPDSPLRFYCQNLSSCWF